MGLFNRRKAAPDEVIDLRLPTATGAQWGSPLPCQSCGGRGYLDHIDPYREIMYIHCTQCMSRYEVSKAELDLRDTDSASSGKPKRS